MNTWDLALQLLMLLFLFTLYECHVLKLPDLLLFNHLQETEIQSGISVF